MDINEKINMINEQMNYSYDKKIGLSKSKFVDELRSVSIISNIENVNYDNSYSQDELENFIHDKNFIDKKEFQLFGDDVHKILELVYMSSQTKDSICEKMTSVQAKIDFENLYNKLSGNLNSLVASLNLDKNGFFPELKVCDGYNHGKFDAVVKTKDNEFVIIDYKTSSNIGINYKIQINLYKKILETIYDIKIKNSYLVKIDKETYNFTLIEVCDIEDKFLTPLLENGFLNQDLVFECVETYVNNSQLKTQEIINDTSLEFQKYVDEINSYNLDIEVKSSQIKEKNAQIKNLVKEISDLKILIEERLNLILGEVDLNKLSDEVIFKELNFKIIKKDSAKGNSPKFIQQYNNKEAILNFCLNHYEDFFNKVSDLRSLKSYMWKNHEQLRDSNFVLDYEFIGGDI